MKGPLALVAGVALLASCGGSPEVADQPAPSAALSVAGNTLWADCRPGEEPAVVYLHGLGGSSSNNFVRLDAEVDSAAPENGSCRYDRVNSGRSGSSSAPQTLSGAVDELVAVLDQADIDGKVVLVAHSYGGLIATAYAGAHPDRVQAIVHADSILPSDLTVFTPRVRAELRSFTEGNAEHVDVLAAYQAAAQVPATDVPVTYVDALQEDPPTMWGARGYRPALEAYLASLSDGALVTSDTNHFDVLNSPELLETVLAALG